jgi:hypothetical protein
VTGTVVVPPFAPPVVVVPPVPCGLVLVAGCDPPSEQPTKATSETAKAKLQVLSMRRLLAGRLAIFQGWTQPTSQKGATLRRPSKNPVKFDRSLAGITGLGVGWPLASIFMGCCPVFPAGATESEGRKPPF